MSSSFKFKMTAVHVVQYGKQTVEILELYVEIKKSKNELFKISYILIYLGTF